MKITAHTLVRNEENFVWYAINSVINCVDEIFVWDMGSTDKTVEIIQSIKDKKVKFRQINGKVEVARQDMLRETTADWIFILDGDEIWSDSAISNLQNSIYTAPTDIEAIVSPNYMLVGDMYHYQESKAGRYKIGDRMGNLNIRAIRNTPGLHVDGEYPNEAFVTMDENKVQDLPSEKILFADEHYLHASFLKRTSMSESKYKYELGLEFSKDYYYPEVFFRDRPNIVPLPWTTTSLEYKIRAVVETPLKKLKRRLI